MLAPHITFLKTFSGHFEILGVSHQLSMFSSHLPPFLLQGNASLHFSHSCKKLNELGHGNNTLGGTMYEDITLLHFPFRTMSKFLLTKIKIEKGGNVFYLSGTMFRHEKAV